jgi:hypothetical protein
VVEAYAFLQGLILSKTLNAPNLTVVGDSKLIVKYLIYDPIPWDFRLASILERIKQVKISFSQLHCYHALHDNNFVMDYQENLATRGGNGVFNYQW